MVRDGALRAPPHHEAERVELMPNRQDCDYNRREGDMTSARFALATMLASAMLAIGMASGADPKTFPEKPIKLVAPFPAGGPTDTAARVVAQGLSARLSQPVVIENQAGAGGTIGAKQVATANP